MNSWIKFNFYCWALLWFSVNWLFLRRWLSLDFKNPVYVSFLLTLQNRKVVFRSRIGMTFWYFFLHVLDAYVFKDTYTIHTKKKNTLKQDVCIVPQTCIAYILIVHETSRIPQSSQIDTFRFKHSKVRNAKLLLETLLLTQIHTYECICGVLFHYIFFLYMYIFHSKYFTHPPPKYICECVPNWVTIGEVHYVKICIRFGEHRMRYRRFLNV